MPDTDQQDVTVSQVESWLRLGTLIATPYGDVKVFGVYYGSDTADDLVVGASIVEPRTNDPTYDKCWDALYGAAMFFTPEAGWEMGDAYVARRSSDISDVRPPIEQEVLNLLRRRSGAYFANKIDERGHVWADVYLGHAKPDGMGGREFVRHVRALQKAGLYVSYGSYTLLPVKPNGSVRITD